MYANVLKVWMLTLYRHSWNNVHVYPEPCEVVALPKLWVEFEARKAMENINECQGKDTDTERDIEELRLQVKEIDSD